MTSIEGAVEFRERRENGVACEAPEGIFSSVVSVDQIETSFNSSSEFNTQTASAKDFIEDKSCPELVDGTEGEVTTPMNLEGTSEDDDDFGDFEEAAELEEQNPAVDGKFGDFNEGTNPEAAAAVNLSSSSSYTRTDDGSCAAASVLKLRGIDFTAAVSKSFRGITPDSSPFSGGLGELAVLRDLKLTACTESRFGGHLLYRRPLPAGFLRTSGIPVLLSSQIGAAEQRLLDRLGMQEAYAQTQKDELLACHSTSVESMSQASASPTPSRELGSEVLSATSDANLDLDFLVQFSSQPLGASAASSNNEPESARCEELSRHSNLHDLFIGIVESSQSSTFSLSSGLSDHKHDDNLLPTPTLQAKSMREPCLKEEDWDAFVDATGAPLEESTTNNNSKTKVSGTEVPDELREADVSASIDRKEKDAGENDIFSGEWLNQLRSCHEIPIVDNPPVASSVERSRPADSMESEWGTFEDASSNQTANNVADVFSSHVAAPPDRVHPSPFSHNLRVRELQPSAPVLKTDLSNQWTSLNTLAIDQVTSNEPAAQLLEEEDWGGFQG